MEAIAIDNAQVVRRGYQAFNEADMNTLNELFHDNASWHTPGKSSIAGDHIGKNEVFTQFGHYGGDTNGSFRADLKEVFSSEDGRVIGLHHNTGERNGKKLDVWCCIEFELEDGQIMSGREYFYDLHNWDQFWS